MDIKEGVTAAAPRDETATMPRDNAERVVEGDTTSRRLGERMRAARLLDRAVVIRELLPQDLKLDIDLLAEDDARDVARYLGAVVGAARAPDGQADTHGVAHRTRPHPREDDRCTDVAVEQHRPAREQP